MEVVPDKKSSFSRNVKRSLLLKIISKSTPTKEDLDSVIELTATKVVGDLKAQSMTVYLVEGDNISFKYVYYSPSLWAGDPLLEQKFEEKRQQLLKLRIPLGTGLVGKVIQTGESNIFTADDGSEELHNLSKNTDFKVTSMMTVPLKDQRIIGAIQILNKEPSEEKQVFDNDDLTYLQEIAEYTSALLLRLLDPNYEINENDTAKYIARFTEMPLVTSEQEIDIDRELVEAIGGEIVIKTGIFPYRRVEERSVAVLTKNPMDFQNREAFSLKAQFMIDEVAVVPVSLFDRLCQLYFQSDAAQLEQDALASGQSIHEITSLLGQEYADLEEVDESNLEALKSENEASSPIVKLVNQVIEDAYFSGSSDIHIEPREDKLVVRYRIDGICTEKLALPPKISGAVVARIKIMCDLDIAQKRLPQDGRIDFGKFTPKKINIDLRVATCPSLFGEKIVMRILDKTKSALPITSLGFSEENLENYRKCIAYPYGMILHCGPTGSGKSMTLFSALREVANPEINIQTAEDPIEYTIPGINQLQTHKAIGLTFAAALRSFLRMD
ncbi:MAG: Flp pilus assembly complex ATPase component TadA, partial [Puniceicoccales bacterium]|nr:Flp pilus assembly complex ATPase component TadA [Puniceicoccales bacterium]